MGVFTDYFKCPPSELNFRLLSAGGFWPIETKNKRVQIIHSIYSFLSCFSIISMLFIQVLDVYLLRSDKINLVKNLCASSITFASVGKYLLQFYKIDKTHDLHKELKKFSEDLTDPEDIEIIEKGEKEILWITKFFYGMALSCIIVWMIYPGLESRHEKRVPFPYRLPIDFKVTPAYEIVYVYQSMSMFGFLINISSIDMTFCGFIIRINAMTNIIAKNIRGLLKENEGSNLNDNNAAVERYDPATTKRIDDSIKKNIGLQQKVYERIDQLKATYKHTYVLHFIGVITLVGTVVLELVAVHKGFKLQMIQRMIYGACGLFGAFLLCFFGTRLEDECMKLRNVIYETPWHEMSPKTRKYLILMMMRWERATTLRMSNYFPLNLSTFLEFLKVSYNITALLYHTIRK